MVGDVFLGGCAAAVVLLAYGYVCFAPDDWIQNGPPWSRKRRSQS